MIIDAPTTITALCGVISSVAIVHMRLSAQAAKRRDRAAQAANDACEKRFADISTEIKSVRDASFAELLRAAREQTQAMAEATAVKRENTRVLDRVCRRLETLPCARDLAERRPLQDPTPQAHDALPEHRSHHP